MSPKPLHEALRDFARTLRETYPDDANARRIAFSLEGEVPSPTERLESTLSAHYPDTRLLRFGRIQANGYRWEVDPYSNQVSVTSHGGHWLGTLEFPRGSLTLEETIEHAIRSVNLLDSAPL